MEYSIKVDVDSLVEKILAIQEDGYVTVRLTITPDDYISELLIEALGVEFEDGLSYGTLLEENEDI